MSDFDKEAERERLREKYEREQEKRQSTERMSELLLKGATMTNAHCEQCGDPIFRYDGQEFCPTCQQVVADDAGDADDAGADGDTDGETAAEGRPAGESESGAAGAEAATGTDARDTDATAGAAEASDEMAGASPGDIEIKQPSGPRTGQPTDANGAETRENVPADTDTTAKRTPPQGGSRDEAGRQEPGGEAGRQQAGGEADAHQPGRGRQSDPSQSVPSVQPASQSGGEVDDALVEARASLTRTLLKQSRAAEGAEDPGQARDHLAAAREAAEALSALSSY